MKQGGHLVRAAVGGALAAAVVLALVAQDQLEIWVVDRTLRELDIWAPPTFMTGFVLATILFVPGSLFGLAGGVLFGPIWGAVWNLLGATVGAIASFLIARYLAGDWVTKRVGGRLQAIVQGAEAEGWRFVALTRLVPIVPFNLLNYALGLTRIRLPHYVLATLLCMAPGAAAYAWLGHAGREAAAGSSEALSYGLVGLGLLALIAFLPRLVRRMKDASGGWITVAELKQRLASGAALRIIDVREPEEVAGPPGHIPGARNIPLRDLPARLDEILAGNAAETVLVCRTDKRSAKAADVLRSAAIQNVLVLRGGVEEWRRNVNSFDVDQGAAG